jgi:K+-sensing histidine kinase KdpD
MSRQWTAAGLAVLAPALATLLNFPIQSLTGGRAPFLTYFAGVVLAALYGGGLAGLAALVLSCAAAAAFFLPVNGMLFMDAAIPPCTALVIFVVFGSASVLVADQFQRRVRIAREAREQLVECAACTARCVRSSRRAPTASASSSGCARARSASASPRAR